MFLESAREVVRCKKCQLVQFRTISGLCRRCDDPLPVPIVIPEEIKEIIPVEPEIHRKMPVDLYPEIADEFLIYRRNLALIRKERRCMTQDKLGEMAKIRGQYISRIEHGWVQCPDIKILQRLAIGLQISLATLFIENVPDPLEEEFISPTVLNPPQTVKKLLAERSISQGELSRWTGIDRAKICFFIGNRRPFSLYNLARIAIYGFNMSLYEFVSRMVRDE